MMAVAIAGGATGEPARPVKLFTFTFLRGVGGSQYSVAADGQRFLAIQPAGITKRLSGVSTAPIIMEINWANGR